MTIVISKSKCLTNFEPTAIVADTMILPHA